MANSNAATLIGFARNILRTESTSHVPVIQDTFMLAALSQANLEWARTHRRGGSEPIVFLRETGFDLVSDTALNGAITTASTSVVVDDSSDLDSSGAVIVWDDDMPDIVEYTGNAANTLTAATGIAFAHEDDDKVQKLYALPSNFKAFRPSDGYGDGVQYNGLPLRFREGPPDPGYFSLYDNGTTKYLWLPRWSSNSVSVLYEKSSTTIDSTDDTVDVPQEHEFFLVWRMVEKGYFGRGDDMNKVIYAKEEANRILREALKERNVSGYVRVRPIRPYNPFYTDPSLSEQQ